MKVSRKQLSKSFHRHWKVYSSSAPSTLNMSHRLLLFYAVECGLKSIILKRLKKEMLDALDNHQELRSITRGSKGHDINIMLRYLKLPAYCIQEIRTAGDSISCSELHLVWRYGVEIPRADETDVEKKLVKICKWIEGEI